MIATFQEYVYYIQTGNKIIVKGKSSQGQSNAADPKKYKKGKSEDERKLVYIPSTPAKQQVFCFLNYTPSALQYLAPSRNN